jgi:DUF1365 family protein
MGQSALYVGRVVHERFRPRRHRLNYRAYWMLLDLDELPSLGARLRLFSVGSFNLFSFRNEDNGSREREPLRDQVELHLRAAGIDIGGGAIRLLTMPRVLGYAFNPLSIYFCHRADGSLAALIYEVHNTFRQRHSYLIAVERTGDQPIRQSCEKRFYVSPFLHMDLTYDFTVVEPGETVRVVVRGSDHDGPMIVASLTGARVPLTDARLLGVFFSHPLMTLKVIAAIHWEAVRLWMRGLRLYPRPSPPSEPVTAAHKLATTTGDHHE